MKFRALAPALLLLAFGDSVALAGAVQRTVMVEEFGFFT
jgi:hypothetical protein